MPSQTAAPPGVTGEQLDALRDARSHTLALVAHLDDDALERVHSPLMSPLVWDLGHIAAFEDLWLAHRGAGLPLLRPDLAEVYDAFETPRAQRGDLPYLRRHDAIAYLAAVRERVLEAADRDPARPAGDAVLHELVLRHEQQHTETMLQTMQLAHLPAPPAATAAPAIADGELPRLTGLELVKVPAGPCTLGAPADGFAYDNERPRHACELPAFRIGRAPVTNGAFQAFIEGGGYARPEWWTREAWAWKEQYDIQRPAGWTADGREWQMNRCEPLDPSKPVVHISWFEADAFARAHGARLPTEAEWEKAATWDQQTQTARPLPWGGPAAVGADAQIAARANVDQRAFGTVAVGTHPDGASPAGCLGMIGDTWEWTASGFDGYPGFVPFPYREYSEVFFGGDYRVLRGGSWATRARVATPTFRNWDHPQRRQIFSGLRIAKDV